MADTTLFVDADMILFGAASACRSTVDWESNGAVITDTLDVNSARDKFLKDIKALEKSCKDAGAKPTRTVLCLTGPENFRRDVLPTYKGGRSAKPPGYRRLQDWVKRQEDYTVFMRDGLEADDCLGILMTHAGSFPGRKVLWSGDKDLMQIPGTHLIGGELVEVSARDGELLHVRQTLTGDVTDGYTGLIGFGPAAWETMRKKVEEKTDGELADYWMAVKAAYEKKGKNIVALLQQARCARILRDTDYDFKKRQVILWELPKELEDA